MGFTLSQQTVIGTVLGAHDARRANMFYGPITGKFNTNDPDGATFVGTAGVPCPVKRHCGDDVYADLTDYKFKMGHCRFQAGIKLETKRFLANPEQYRNALRGLGNQGANHAAKQIINLINRGELDTTPIDGQPFYGPTHTWDSSTLQSNLLLQAVGTPAQPTAQEITSAVYSAVEQILGFSGAGGACDMINEGTTRFLITAPLHYMQVIKQLFSNNPNCCDGSNMLVTDDEYMFGKYYSAGFNTGYTTGTPGNPGTWVTGVAPSGNAIQVHAIDSMDMNGGPFAQLWFDDWEVTNFGIGSAWELEHCQIKTRVAAEYGTNYYDWTKSVQVNFV